MMITPNEDSTAGKPVLKDVPVISEGNPIFERRSIQTPQTAGSTKTKSMAPIRKINIATATFASVEKQVRSDYAEGKIGGYYDLHQSEIQGAYSNAKAHMEIFYSVGKA